MYREARGQEEGEPPRPPHPLPQWGLSRQPLPGLRACSLSSSQPSCKDTSQKSRRSRGRGEPQPAPPGCGGRWLCESAGARPGCCVEAAGAHWTGARRARALLSKHSAGSGSGHRPEGAHGQSRAGPLGVGPPGVKVPICIEAAQRGRARALGAGQGTNGFRLQVGIKLLAHHKAEPGPRRPGLAANGGPAARERGGRSRLPGEVSAARNPPHSPPNPTPSGWVQTKQLRQRELPLLSSGPGPAPRYQSPPSLPSCFQYPASRRTDPGPRSR